jgi:hypothetical protein
MTDVCARVCPRQGRTLSTLSMLATPGFAPLASARARPTYPFDFPSSVSNYYDLSADLIGK